MNPSEVYGWLGVDAVLLPIKPNSKKPNLQKWQQTTFSQTQSPAYQRRLEKAPALGVLLGNASQGLCSIDCDDEDFLDEMLRLNPRLRETLRTSAERGANLWVVLEDEPPRTREFSLNGAHLGEFRSTRSYTIITGAHPSGCDYRRTVCRPPLRIRYSDIRWPWGLDGCAGGRPANLSECSQDSQSLHTLNSLHHLRPLNPLHNNLGEKIRAGEEAARELSENRALSRLFRAFIEKKYTPRQGRRNSDLIAMVTFLFNAVGKSQLMALCQAYHQINQAIFLDPLEQHLKEAAAHFAACEREWLAGLSDAERKEIESFPALFVEAFRICRDLAKRGFEPNAPGCFFLSCNDLADRLDVHPPKANQILGVFQVHGFLMIVKAGIKRAKGQRGSATTYRWCVNA